MNFQLLILTIFRLFLGIIFLVSFVSKANDTRGFIAILAAFKLIPNAWVQPFAFTLISLESIIAALLLTGWQSRVAAALCGFLLVIFTVALSLSLLRGRSDLECGCFGAKRAQKINLNLISRNIGLLVVAMCIVRWGGGLLALDNHSLVLGQLFIEQEFLPIMLVCAGTLIFTLLVWQLYRLLLLIPLEE